MLRTMEVRITTGVEDAKDSTDKATTFTKPVPMPLLLNETRSLV